MEELKIHKIGIHSVPRSGSSWLGALFDSNENVAYRFQPLFSFTHKDSLNSKSNRNEIAAFFQNILHTKDEFVLQKSKDRSNLKPIFLKDSEITHLVYKEVRYHHIIENLLENSKDVKIIGLIRSPFAVINSWLKAPKEFRADLGWQVEKEWKFAPSKNLNRIEEFNGYNKWKEVAFMFLKFKKEFPEQFYLIEYDYLIQNTSLEVKKLFKFCGLNYTKQTENFIKESKTTQSKDSYSVFKQKKDDLGWQKTLPKFIEEEIKSDPEFKILNNKFKWI